ncbi:MAG: outer membrane beta-barrel protein [Verrucomicrobiota bacterium]|nr:outer membrane beta-barrel protein [Verrucomicrobiota bacterium]
MSLSSVAQAQEAAGGAEALAASTTVSGYISTSYTSMSDNGHGNTFRNNVNDKFALDVVSLSISNGDLGAEAGSAAYNLELWIGPAARNIGTGSTFGSATWTDVDNDGAVSDGDTITGGGDTVELMEANIELLASLGEQDVKLTVGQFGTTVGAETYSYAAADNSFHSRSFAFAIEPTHHTGVKAETTVGGLNVLLGLVNDTTSAITNSGQGSNAILTGLSHTLGSGTGWLEGTELSYGGVHEAGDDNSEVTNYYVGLSKEIVTDLTYSLAWDIREEDNSADSNVVGHYLSYPLGGGTLNVRWEHGNINGVDLDGDGTQDNDENIDGLESITVGYDYPIWTGVTSRVEFRSDDWDGKDGGANESFALNLVYNF